MVFESLLGVFVTAALFKPADADQTGKETLPALLHPAGKGLISLSIAQREIVCVNIETWPLSLPEGLTYHHVVLHLNSEIARVHGDDLSDLM